MTPRLTRRPAIVADPRRSEFPLSFAQQRLWFLHQLDPASTSYNVCIELTLAGDLHEEALEKSFQEIVRRHHVLRTRFECRNGNPVAVVDPGYEFAFDRVDLRGLDKEAAEAALLRERHEAIGRPFDLASGRLLRVTLIRTGARQWVALCTWHHIVADGWSTPILVRELRVLYECYRDRVRSPLADLPVQYGDFAAWQRAWLTGDVLARHLDYWRGRLDGMPAVLELPTDHARPPTPSHRGSIHPFHVDADVMEGVRRIARSAGTTTFAVLLSALNVLLSRYSGRDDIVIGTPIANRTRLEVEGLIGFFLNTLVLRTSLRGAPSCLELLMRVKEVTLGAYAHHELPFELLVEALSPERNLSLNPLFQIMFVLLHDEAATFQLPGVELHAAGIHNGTSKLDLLLHARECERGLVARLEYSSDLYEPDTIAWMAEHWTQVLREIVSRPEAEVRRLPLMTVAERRRLDAARNVIRPQTPFAVFAENVCEGSIWDRFLAQADRYPARTAVADRTDSWTYAQLRTAAGQVARRVEAVLGRANEPVVLWMPHDRRMVAGILGLLQAGKAYVPIDATYPDRRVLGVVSHSCTRAVVAASEYADRAAALGAGVHIIRIDDIEGDRQQVEPFERDAARAANALAYILYTSGSTGTPKGVVQTDRNVLRHIRNYTNALHIACEDRLALLASYACDAAVMDMFGALLNGASLQMFDVRQAGPSRLATWLPASGVTILHATPTVFRALAESLATGDVLPSIRLVVLGGEEVDVADFHHFLAHFDEGCIFVNGLGPTECTLAFQYFASRASLHRRRKIPVGYPVEGIAVELVDDAGSSEVFGEIVLSGPQLFVGYWPQQLQEREALPHEPRYRTGDLARRLPDGSFEYRGRKDLQIKIRGHRVEIPEVEARLLELPRVRRAAVVAYPNEATPAFLVAYVLTDGDRNGDVDAIRKHLESTLPQYMIPVQIASLPELPVTSTGKLDRAALRARTPAPAATAPPQPLTDPLERVIAQAFRTVLGAADIARTTSFFDLGGHSLLVFQLLARLEELLDVAVPVRAVFDAPTIEGLARHVLEAAPDAAALRRSAEMTLDVLSLSDAEADERIRAWSGSDSTLG